MKTKALLIIAVLLNGFMFGQDSLDFRSDKPKVIGFSPSKKTKNVNGILLKYYDEIDADISPKKVNGLGLGMNGLGIFFPFLMLVNVGSIDSWSFSDVPVDKLPKKMNKINGVQVSIINMEPTVTNGLELNVSSNIGASSVINGVSISPLYNFHHTSNGFVISPLANISQKCRGLQIALFNSCKDSKGLQIGFWNVNQKRKLPFVNWNFKSKNKKS